MEPSPSVFLLQHVYADVDGNEHVKIIGVYRSRELADRAANKAKALPGFRDTQLVVSANGPEGSAGFHVDEYFLDVDHWTEGFVLSISEC
jgi:hypothetical protein